jgi:Family of unknown function (DUF6186)
MSRIILIGLFIVAGCLFVVVSWLSRRKESTIPTFGDMSAFVMEYRLGKLPVGRVAVLGFWWWVGWHFFAR